MTDAIHGIQAMRSPGPILPRWLQTVDQWVLISVFMLFAIGLLLGMAASPTIAQKVDAGAFTFVFKQAVFGAVALGVMVAISALPIKHVRRIGFAVFLISFVGILLLPFLGTGFGKGATRWYSLGFGSIQPSEFLKPGFILVGAWLLAGSMQRDGPPGVTLSGALVALIALLLMLQPDYGQASLIVFSWIVMFFVSGAPILPLFGIGGALMLVGWVAYSQSEHFAGRIDTYVAGIIEANSQLDFSMNAMREGGLFGVGVGEGSIKYNLPDAHTDFIVAVAAEEYGLLFVLLIVFLFAFISIRSLVLISAKQDPFKRLAGAGLAALFGIQAFINIGVSVNLLPAKGMTLPFISYGGSSVISVGILLGMLLAMTRSEPMDLPGRKQEFRSV